MVITNAEGEISRCFSERYYADSPNVHNVLQALKHEATS